MPKKFDELRQRMPADRVRRNKQRAEAQLEKEQEIRAAEIEIELWQARIADIQRVRRHLSLDMRTYRARLRVAQELLKELGA